MFKPLSRAFAALTLLFAPAVNAQAVQDADPALWVVKDDDTTIYLFGTVHVLKPGLGWFDEAVKDAFDKSGQVMLEMVEPDPMTMQQELLKVAMRAEGPTITEQLPEDKRAAYAKALEGSPVTVANFEYFEPWLPALQVTVQALTKNGYDPESGAERVISAAAKEANKPVAGLETFQEQIGYLHGLPPEVQIQFLIQSIDQAAEGSKQIDAMVALWSKGDADGVASLLNDEMKDAAALRKQLLTDRNARWADWIAKRMETPGTVFIAVGAGHLAGSDSVQAFLAKHDIKATRIAY